MVLCVIRGTRSASPRDTPFAPSKQAAAAAVSFWHTHALRTLSGTYYQYYLACVFSVMLVGRVLRFEDSRSGADDNDRLRDWIGTHVLDSSV